VSELYKLNSEAAIKYTIELAKINIQSSNQWVPGEEVAKFMETVFDYLTTSEIKKS